TGYQAGAGYDAATGLGSVDVSQLISNWKSAAFTATNTSLTINGSTAAVTATHGQSLTFGVSVNPGTASGDVVILNANNNNGSAGPLQHGGIIFPDTGVNFLTLSGGKASDSSNQLPGGSYAVGARYSGDTTNASSTSNSILVTIAAEDS